MGDGALNDEQSVPLAELRDHILLEYSSASESLRRRRHHKILTNLAKLCSHSSNPSAHGSSNCLKSLEAANNVKQLSVPAVVFPAVEKLPDGILWVRASTNVRLPESFSDDYHVPYLGESDEHQASSSKLAKILCDDDSEMEDNSDVEGLEPEFGVSSEVEESDAEEEENGVLLLEADLDHVSRAKRKNRRSSFKTDKRDKKLPVSAKVGELRWDRQAKLIALQRFSVVFLPPNCDELTPKCAKAVMEAFKLSNISYAHAYMSLVTKRSHMWETKKKGEEQLDAVRAEVLNHIKGNGSSSAATVLGGDSIPFFFCRQCYVYDCSLHGNCDSGPSVPIPDRTRKDSATKQVVEDIEKGCKDHFAGNCWCLGSKDDECAKWWADSYETSINLIDDLKALLQKLLPIFGKDFCRVSETVRTLLRESHDIVPITCCRIGYVSTVMFNNLLETPVSSRGKKLQKLRSCKPAAEMEFMNGGIRPDYKPCRHDGPCTAENCTCVANGVFCEKYCGCNHSRPNQMKHMRHCSWAFPGCSCKSACSSNLCPCFSWKRECDPDLCRYCHECKDTKEGAASFTCRNVSLRLKRNCRLLAGRSNVHGWGVFAAYDVAQNEMIGEYVGEVLGDQVAERRGRLYDEVQSTFLFEITKGLSLDSTRIGNKLRYCNHSSDANLEPRLMRVAGDVRIGIFARRGIKKYEELFFNYGSKFKNRWEMKDSKDGKAELRATKHKKTALLTLESDDENDFTNSGERVKGRSVSNKIQKPDACRNDTHTAHNLIRRNRTNINRHRRTNSLQELVSSQNGSTAEFGEDFPAVRNELRPRRRSLRLGQGSRPTSLHDVGDSDSCSEDNGTDPCQSSNPSGQAADHTENIRISWQRSLRAAGSPASRPHQWNIFRSLRERKESPWKRRTSVRLDAKSKYKCIDAGSSSCPDIERATLSMQDHAAGVEDAVNEPPLKVARHDIRRNNNDMPSNFNGKQSQIPRLEEHASEGHRSNQNSGASKAQFNSVNDEGITIGNDRDGNAISREFRTEAQPVSLVPSELATGAHVISSVSDADADKVENDNLVSEIAPARSVQDTGAWSREEVHSSKRRLYNQEQPRIQSEAEGFAAKRHKIARRIVGTASGGGGSVAKKASTRENQDSGKSGTQRGKNVSVPKRVNPSWKKLSSGELSGEFPWGRWRIRGLPREGQSPKSKLDSEISTLPPTSSPPNSAHHTHDVRSSLRKGSNNSIRFANATNPPNVKQSPTAGLASEVINLVTDDEAEHDEVPNSLHRGGDSDTSFDPNFGKYTLS